MTLTEQIMILDDKIKTNKAQYDLDGEAAKISALSSKNLEKYEYLTGEDLGYKPDVIQRAKFEYSPLGEAFNKVFKKDDKNKKVIKHDNDLVYNSIRFIMVYNFISFNDMSYKDLLKLNDVKSQIKIQSKIKFVNSVKKCIIALL